MPIEARAELARTASSLRRSAEYSQERIQLTWERVVAGHDRLMVIRDLMAQRSVRPLG